jgi:hypothetical protein
MIMTDSASTPPSPATPAKKGGMGKLIFRLVIVFVLLAVVGLVALYFAKDGLVRAGVIRGGKYATEQDTGLVNANLSLFGGALTLDELGISNLAGYKEKHLLVMKKCATTLEPGSLFTDTVVISEIAIDGLELTLEQNGAKNNLNELIAIIQKKMPPAGQTTSESPGKKLKIVKLHLTGTKVHIRAAPINLDLDLGPIEMIDPTNPDGRPMKIADLVARILLNISKQAIEDPRLPLDIKNNMKNVTAVVDNMRGQLDKGVKDLSKGLTDLTKDPLKAIQSGDLNKTIQDAGKNAQDIGRGLQNLNPFGGGATTTPK